MYTRKKVGGFLKSVALCVLLLFGTAPVAALACQRACMPQADQAHHHAGHHEDSAEAAQAPPTGVDMASVRSLESTCDHAADVAPALTSAFVKVFAPAIVPAAPIERADFARAEIRFASNRTGSPPGVQTRPLALRI